MKIDVTDELKDYLLHFRGNPQENQLSLTEKISVMFIDDNASLVYRGKEYPKTNIPELVNDILNECKKDM